MLVIAATAVAADQASKFLAVKHLTPGLGQAAARAARGSGTPVGGPTAAPAETPGLLSQIATFYTDVEHPCRQPGAYCPPKDVIEDFWAFRYVENPGAAWGLFADARESVRRPFFLVVALIAVGFIIGYYRRLEADQRMLAVALSLVLGGAIGNFIDRLHLSYVIDFIDWYVIWDGRPAHWPTFNIADAAISIGVCLLLLDTLTSKQTDSDAVTVDAESVKSS